MPMRLLISLLVLVFSILVSVNTRAQSLQSVDLHGNNNTVVQIIFEVSQGDPDFLRKNESRITKLAQTLGVSNALIVNFLGKIDLGDVPRERWPEILAKVAQDYAKFQESADLLSASDPIAKDLIDKAKEAARQAQFAEADRLLIEAEAQEEAAHDKIQEAELKRQLNLVSLKAIRAQNFMVQRRFLEAAALYEKAAGLAERVGEGKQVEMLEAEADAYFSAGEDNGDNKALRNVIIIYQDKLIPLHPRNTRPIDWALKQNELGAALRMLGERERDPAKLQAALDAHRSAQQELTRERVPIDWAITQMRLGHVFMTLGQLERGTNKFEAALEAYRAGQQEATRERQPNQWAAMQDGIGSALSSIGERESGSSKLKEAVAAYRVALEHSNREIGPFDWATTQNNLATTLFALGQREIGRARLDEAVIAYRAALEEWKRELWPLNWALAQSNLGLALSALGDRTNDRVTFSAAIQAYNNALLEQSRDRAPSDWARTQNGLGTALMRLGELEGSATRLSDAVDAYQDALKEWTRESAPYQWSKTQLNLGLVLMALAERDANTAHFEEAISAFHAAQEEQTTESVPLDWAQIQANLGRALAMLGARKQSPQLIRDGKASVQSAWDVYKAAGDTQYDDYFARQLADVEAAIAKLEP